MSVTEPAETDQCVRGFSQSVNQSVGQLVMVVLSTAQPKPLF